MDSLKEKVRTLPDLPGVYLMKDEKAHVLYVGKAKSLKKRVSSYFLKTAGQSTKTLSLVTHISDIDYIVTSSEVEALILENNLIKRYRPRYNVILRDDKNYPYLRLSSEEYPKLSVVRGVKKDKAHYFGPYTSATSMRETLRLIRRVFPVRGCSDEAFRGRKRPCLNYQMGRCLAPCVGLIGKDEYGEIVNGIRMFLEGKNRELVRNLGKEMVEASSMLDFENAAKIRDRISAVKKVLERQSITSGKLIDQDYLAVSRKGEEAQAIVLFVRGGSVTGSKSFPFSKVGETPDTDILASFVTQFYTDEKFIPEEVVVPFEIVEKGVIERWLTERKGKSVKVVRPVRGERVKVLEMARKNAELALKDRLGLEETGNKNLEGLKDILQLRNLPQRIEAFDISNIGGKEAVASMIVFEGGRPKKGDYRHFKIKTIEGANDYGMMAEVLLRRYSRLVSEGEKFPDLIMVDGGKGQLNVALSVAKELNLEGVDIISLAKERGEATDRVFVPNVKDAKQIPRDSPVLHLLQYIRDESHRFAITYHKKLRGKKLKQSDLLDIPGIGEAKTKALLKHLGSLDKVKEADEGSLAKVPGITKKDAEAVFSWFHGNP
ncbi:MAG: excinuclease ABC subunit UvrC [Deltaproteobacteria bacterium]|nr:excinuclease ABC subunit UvrC [Deltaproteobacteria bacterium]